MGAKFGAGFFAGETELSTEEVDGLTRDYVEEHLGELEANVGSLLDSLRNELSEEEWDYLNLIIAAIWYDQKHGNEWETD